MCYLLQNLFQFMGTLVFVSVSNPWTLLITAPVLVVILFLRYYAVKTIMDIKRLEAASKLNSELRHVFIGLLYNKLSKSGIFYMGQGDSYKTTIVAAGIGVTLMTDNKVLIMLMLILHHRIQTPIVTHVS